jgi:hypothetical protein
MAGRFFMSARSQTANFEHSARGRPSDSGSILVMGAPPASPYPPLIGSLRKVLKAILIVGEQS